MSQPLPVRYIRVTAVRRLTPHMIRVSFGAPDLADLGVDGPDRQVKLYFPRSGREAPRLPDPGTGNGDVMRWYAAYSAIPENERPWMRSYTVRAHRPHEAAIDIDFVLHDDAGPATRWAASAAPGDTLGMFGPSAYFAPRRPHADADWMLLAGDESALPAIGTLLEALPAGSRAVAYVEVPERADEQSFDTPAEVTVHWLHRHRRSAPPAVHGELLIDAVRGAAFPDGPVRAWLAGEAGAVRAMRRHLVQERGLAKPAVEFSGYWRARLSQDDAPTEEDLAEARERLADAKPAP
ncbi:siderophore-interacting protein [Streptomyces sp. NPDC048389]|uniref:siderophore-interacting protein n=1 Tax=Streptomyces sp. NPDC048389 TaxID=3154622 RepID=UPI0034520622